MMCEAQEALKAWVKHEEDSPGYMGSAKHLDIVQLLEQSREALISDDCIPREVAEQAREFVKKVKREQDAEKGTKRPCLFCYEERHIDDCPGAEITAVLAALDKALKGISDEPSLNDN